jgi:DNA-binding NarL/FixJ family response regulator
MTLSDLRLSVAIIDANPLLADGISALLLQEPQFVARTVFLGSEICPDSDEVSAARFDVIIIDPAQFDAKPSSLVRHLSPRAAAMIAYSSSSSESLARTCIEAGFRGVLPKTVSFDVLKIALATTAQGGIFIDAIYASVIMPRPAAEEGNSASDQNVRLSERELFVLKSVAHGKSMKEIGKELDLSSKTVETYKARGSSKLNLSGRRQIVEFAIAQGWVATTNPTVG